MKEELKLIHSDFENDVKAVSSVQELKDLKIKYLMNDGRFSSILNNMRSIPEAERPSIGRLVHDTKFNIEQDIEERIKILNTPTIKHKSLMDEIDIHKKSRRRKIGKKSSSSLIIEQINEFFLGLGFKIELPNNDTYINSYISEKENLSIPIKEEYLPLRVITENQTYRKSTLNSYSFIEGVIIDKSFRFSDLTGLIKEFFSKIFNENIDLVLMPNYSSIMSPSVKISIQKNNDTNEFLDILECGMIKPQYLETNKINSNEYKGFVFLIDLEKLLSRL